MSTTTQQSTFHSLAAPVAPGELWPDSDYTYAGIMRGDKGELYHLLVSPASMDLSDLEWGAYGEKIKGADSSWDGLANTRALIASGLALPAAQAVAGDTTPDAIDTYLPAQRELALCWATIPSHFHTDDWYWSSTQYSANFAWVQSFALGGQSVDSESFTGRVRLVRRLVIR